jgi:deoxyinosine 3'endonuclease (endonuclease V)
MSNTSARRPGLARAAALALALATIGVADTTVTAPAADAAGCSFSNLTSKSVKNVNCKLGAYGYKASAGSASGVQVGAWAFPGGWSSNPSAICYAFATMVHA